MGGSKSFEIQGQDGSKGHGCTQQKVWMHAMKKCGCIQGKAWTHIMESMHACNREQMHGASMNEYYAESGGRREGHKRHAMMNVRRVGL